MRVVRKKILSLILVFTMVLGLSPVSVLAEDTLTKTITAFAAVDGITVEVGDEEPTLPGAVTATVSTTTVSVVTDEDGKESQQTQITTAEEPLAVSWTADDTFSSDAVGIFTYTATLTGENLPVLAEGVSLPIVTVTVAEKSDADNTAAPTKTVTSIADPAAVELTAGDTITEDALIATFPQHLTATLEGETDTIDVAVSGWTLAFSSHSSGAFATDESAEIYYEPVFDIPAGYVLSNEIVQTTQKVQVGEALVHTPTPTSTGDFSVVGGTINDDYTFAVHPTLAGVDVLTIISNKELTISGTTISDVIVIADGITANITLNDLNIDVYNVADTCAFEIAGTATANIKLVGTNVLKSGIRKAGIQVQESATLTILKESTGSLNVIGGNQSASIGSGPNASAGTISIHGGNISAEGGASGAGIGSGYSITPGATNGGKITITGGIVTAAGAYNGAGIGGGSNSDGAVVVITGGNVYATGSNDASGIGGGRNGGSGSFSTIDSNNIPGNAFIEVATSSGSASFIDDVSNKDSWSGIIFEWDSGKVYGTPTIENNIVIKSGKTLEVPADSKLTIPTGKQIDIEVGGTITITQANGIQNDGVIFNYGTINTVDKIGGSGKIHPETGNVNPHLSVAGSDIYLRVDGSNKQFSYDNANWENYTETMTITGSTTENQVTIFSGEHDIIFDNLSMQMSNRNASPFMIENSGVANVTLKGDNMMSSYGFAGTMEFTSSATLTITKESTGSLTALSTGNGAAIGGDNLEDGGTVNIYGGSIVAMSTYSGAGIGGGNSGDGGTVNIYGGSIEASSADGMSIGGGSGAFSDPGSINYLAQTENIYQVHILAGDSSTNTSAYNATDNYYEKNYVKITMQEANPNISITPNTALTYNGTVQTQTVDVKIGGATVPSAQYTLGGNTATNAGTYTLSVSNINLNSASVYDSTAAVNYIGSNNSTHQINYSIAKASITTAQVTLGTALTANGAQQTQSVSSVTLNSQALTEGTDYTISGNTVTAAGVYTLYVNGKGNYTGTAIVPFTVSLSYQLSGTLDETDSAVPSGNRLVITELSDAQRKENLEKLTTYADANNITGIVHFLADITMEDIATGNKVQPMNGDTIVRISVPGVTAQDTVTVLHVLADGTVEKITPVTVGNGYVEFSPISFSVYSVIVEKYVAPTTGTTTTNPAISPLTGVYN